MQYRFVVALCVAALWVSFTPVAAQPAGGPYGRHAGNADHGRVVAAAKCAVCHGADGNSTNPQFPKLAGQNPDYLYQQLEAFKSGTRKSTVMAPIVAQLSGADAADVVQFYSQQSVRPDPVMDRAAADEGEPIFLGETAARVPACAMCHSANGQRMPMMGGGMMGGNVGPIPNLYGQHASYLVAQLDQYASGGRTDGVMNSIAGALSESQRKAVAAYLSGLR